MSIRKRQVWWGEPQSLFKEERELELEGQRREGLKALNLQEPAYNYKKSIEPQAQGAEELMTEIAQLEMEVACLEKYLLSLYRSTSFTKPNGEQEEELDSGINRCHSSLAASSLRVSPPALVDTYHSLPLSFDHHTHQESSTSNAAAETPNSLSEEMIKCISTIYSHLSHSPQQQQFSGSFFAMLEVRSIARDSNTLNSVQHLLQSYRSLISKLRQIDPWKLNHQEKLAFWINVHNALVMHAFLVYGVPRSSLKKVSLVLKASYNIGGHTISVDTIQSCILRCRLPRPTLWLHSLFLRKTKFKAGDPREAYAIKYAEPRLHFALCSGCQSDPPVRLYTAKRVFQDLEMAKEEYIQMNIKIHKEERLVMPKNVEYFSKEMGLSPSSIIAEMLEVAAMPDSWGNNFQVKKVEWIPHNFSFRFLLANELVR